MQTNKKSTPTLRARYENRANTRQVVLESRQGSLIIEAMKEQDFNRASEIINKLRGMTGKGITSLDNAIQGAIDELNRYTGGGPLIKAAEKIKSIVGFKNPLVKFMTFANALENGFRLMPQILKNNLGGIDLQANKDKKLSELITDEDKQKALASNMLKALSPKGIYGAFKKVPYVNTEMLVQDLMNVPIANLNNVLQQSTSGPNTNQIAGDIKDNVTSQDGVETKGTTPSTPSEPTAGTKETAPSNKTAGAKSTTSTGESIPRTEQSTEAIVKNVYQKLSTSLEDAAGNKKNAYAVLKLLADEGFLKAQQ